MSKRPSTDFVQVLSESGVPVTEKDFETKLKQEVVGLVVRFRMTPKCHRFGVGFALQWSRHVFG